ncbi:helix-turn-helix transcriptional regulator [Dehalococcoides mccartyi]|uniref:helix-turn-helix transcriptional regulator n=1 Tax=Dehalococcoides mccartyi TaxID=61435 RepID=UPI0019E99028|nr:helix-turn-helix transcriptional regulator [Dehalococcoides mccartyi]MBF4482324.1 helix-turn-helix transcriptional regulator [Dehalococcoides mccartyi]MBJ7531899.1 helix-turn-helix transcriptional regulator [Dehalococcoides mccartyi]
MIKTLRDHRLDKFWSQAELAKQAGIGADTVNRLENGKQNPSFITVRKLAMALDIKPEEIEF